VTVHFNTGVEDAFGDNVLEGLHLVDNATGEKRDLKVNGLFYGIGHQPNSKLVAGQIELDEAGYVKVRLCRGLRAAADCSVHDWGVHAWGVCRGHRAFEFFVSYARRWPGVYTG
jgi:thioredoxin reductase (NADPH)